MKPKKLTIIKHGDTYPEEIMRYGFCPECSELAEFVSKDAAVRGEGLIVTAVTNYKYECKNCGCVWSEDDIVKKQIKTDENVADFLKALLIIFLVVASLAVTIAAIVAVVKLAYSFACRFF